MPDYFDRLIARANDGAAVAFARPRLPGPFERLAAEPPDSFFKAVDEVREVDAAPPRTRTPRARPASLAGTQAGITPPPLLRDSTTPRAPGAAATVTAAPGEQPPARPAPARQLRATPVHLVADAGAAAPDQASAPASRPAAGRDHDTRPSTAGLRPERLIAPPSPPRTLAVPASAVRPAWPAADEARAVPAQPPAPPPVIVRIGRIEVRNTLPDRRERQAKPRAGRPAPKQTLAAYLEGTR